MFKSLLFVLPISMIASTAFGTVSDLTAWDLVEDPGHPNLSASRSASSAILSADGAVPNAFDIGYASVDGLEVGNSNQGYYFSPNEDFEIRIDFDVSAVSSVGGGGFGFGVGEDRNGENSVGVAGAVANGSIVDFFTAGRTGNAPIVPTAYSLPGVDQGRMAVQYFSSTGNFWLKLTEFSGGGAVTITRQVAGIQNNWDDKPLLASFFLRSDDTLGAPLTTGQLTATFSNFTVVSGTPIAVPEPTAAGLMLLGLTCLRRR